jgi:SH3-like domain-containing protein
MFTRPTLAAVVLSPLLFALPSAAQLPGAPEPTPEIENARFATVGQINANSVFIRSGPSENDYPVLKLERGARITVVGMRGDWLKIRPPEGAYCYVAKAFVDRRGDGNIGRVNNTLYVRVGSRLNDMRTKVAMKLDPGTDVKIIDQKDEYFLIEPPEGVFLYVSKRFVDPVAPAGNADNPVPNPAPIAGGNNPTDPAPNPRNPSPTDPTITQNPVADGNNPANADSLEANAGNQPATQPSAAMLKFQELEQQWRDSLRLPLEDQPVATLLAGYRDVLADAATPESIGQLASLRVKALEARMQALADLMEVKRLQAEAAERAKALQAEREELEQRRNQTAIQTYAAVGTLRPSSLQFAGGTLYRLTDPNTGRTVVYIRSDDATINQRLGQFVGVRGELINDARLSVRYITPTLIEVVDPTKVNQSVVAGLIPPSMQPTGTASSGTE